MRTSESAIVLLLVCSSAIVFAQGPCSTATLDFTSGNGQVLANGEEFIIKGANWFGFETADRALHGLWGQISVDEGLDFLVDNGFNALRIPFAVDTLLANPTPPADRFNTEPAMQNIPMLDAMEVVVERAAARNMLVMFDNHRNQAQQGITELWYDPSGPISVDDVKASWSVLAQRFCNSHWNVFAADLKNEPHGSAAWGNGDPLRDWRLGAEDLGNHVLSQCPRWLVFVEGVEKNVVGDTSWWNGWWGGKLQGAALYPVQLTDDSKLVYSPHVYGPDVHAQEFFAGGDFSQMETIWDGDFGYVPGATGKPVVIGEWGGKYRPGTDDRTWQNLMAAYFVDNRFGSFYWSLNPNSGDTGGLLLDDWATPNQDKLDLLSSLPSTDVACTCNGGSSDCTNAPPPPPSTAAPDPPSTAAPSPDPPSTPPPSTDPPAPPPTTPPPGPPVQVDGCQQEGPIEAYGNCTGQHSGCCADGHLCYMLDSAEPYAQCRAPGTCAACLFECEVVPEPCPTRIGKHGNCRASHCCAEGLVCYEQDDGYAQCLEPGECPVCDSWTCNELVNGLTGNFARRRSMPLGSDKTRAQNSGVDQVEAPVTRDLNLNAGQGEQLQLDSAPSQASGQSTPSAGFKFGLRDAALVGSGLVLAAATVVAGSAEAKLRKAKAKAMMM